jgi:hypothetical protein
VVEPQVVEHHAHSLEEDGRIVSGEFPSQVAVAASQLGEDGVFGLRWVDVRHAVQDGSAVRALDNSHGEDVPAGELAGGESLAHLDDLVGPQVAQAESLVRADLDHLVGAEAAGGHALEVGALAGRERALSGGEEALGDGPAAFVEQ